MRTEELVEKYFDAVNNHKWEQLSEVLHPEVRIQHGTTLSRTGRGAAIKLLRAILAQFESHHDQPVRVITDRNVAAVEIQFSGTTTQGSPVTFEAVDIIDTDGDAITKVASWYDTADILPRIKSEPS